MNADKTIRISDAVARLEAMAAAASVSDENNEFVRGLYTAIWHIKNNVPTVEKEARS